MGWRSPEYICAAKAREVLVGFVLGADDKMLEKLLNRITEDTRIVDYVIDDERALSDEPRDRP